MAVGRRVRGQYIGPLRPEADDRGQRRILEIARGELGRRDLAERWLGDRRRWALPIAELGADLLLDRHGIKVAHHHQQRVVRAVPPLVERKETLARRALNDLLGADRQALTDRTVRVKEVQAGHQRAELRRITGTLLGEDHTALAVDRRRREQQTVRRLAHQHQRLVDQLVAGVRQVQLVDRLQEAGVRIRIGTEGEPKPLEQLHHLAFRDVLAAVEHHVLEEMREAALVVGFHHGADPEAHAHRRGLARQRIAHQRVAQSVRQLPVGDRRVGLELGGLVRPDTPLAQRLERGGHKRGGGGGTRSGRGGTTGEREEGCEACDAQRAQEGPNGAGDLHSPKINHPPHHV